MKRIAYAAALAGAGFVSVAAAQPLFAQQNGAAPDRVETRADALARADRMFDRLDANKDGKITPREMVDARGPMGPGGPGKPPAKDGKQPTADGAPPPPPPGGHRGPGGMRRMRGMPGGFSLRMYADLDANDDGVITRDEFRAHAIKMFDRMDTNKDGKIDAAERQAARDAMRHRMGGHGPMGGPGPMGDPDGDVPPPPPPSDPDAGQ